MSVGCGIYLRRFIVFSSAGDLGGASADDRRKRRAGSGGAQKEKESVGNGRSGGSSVPDRLYPVRRTGTEV